MNLQQLFADTSLDTDLAALDGLQFKTWLMEFGNLVENLTKMSLKTAELSPESMSGNFAVLYNVSYRKQLL